MPLTLLQLTPDKVIEFPPKTASSPVSVKLHLRSLADSPVAYKIKTTAPRNYLVRPSAGVLPPGTSVDVHIVLQPNCSGTAAQDRFLVQATTATVSDDDVTKEFWSSVPKESLEDQRLAVAVKGAALPQPTVPQVAVPAAPIAPSAVAQHPTVPEPRKPSGNNGANFEAKYNEMLQYCLALEKQKNSLTRENEALKRSVEGGAATAGSGFSLTTHQAVLLVITAVIAFVISRYV